MVAGIQTTAWQCSQNALSSQSWIVVPVNTRYYMYILTRNGRNVIV